DVLAIVFVSFAAILLLGVVYSFGTSWPFQDSFVMFDWLEGWRTHSISPFDFVRARNNEHFIGFHLLLSLISLIATGGNFKALMYQSALLLAASIAVLIYLLRTTDLTHRHPALTLVVVIASLLNPVQVTYLLWEFQVWWYVVLFCAVIII